MVRIYEVRYDIRIWYIEQVNDRKSQGTIADGDQKENIYIKKTVKKTNQRKEQKEKRKKVLMLKIESV